MSKPNLYFIHYRDNDSDGDVDDLDWFVWAYNARFAVVAWREHVAERFSIASADDVTGPSQVFLVPTEPPVMVGAAEIVGWYGGITPSDPKIEEIPKNEWE